MGSLLTVSFCDATLGLIQFIDASLGLIPFAVERTLLSRDVNISLRNPLIRE